MQRSWWACMIYDCFGRIEFWFDQIDFGVGTGGAGGVGELRIVWAKIKDRRANSSLFVHSTTVNACHYFDAWINIIRFSHCFNCFRFLQLKLARHSFSIRSLCPRWMCVNDDGDGWFRWCCCCRHRCCYCYDARTLWCTHGKCKTHTHTLTTMYVFFF